MRKRRYFLLLVPCFANCCFSAAAARRTNRLPSQDFIFNTVISVSICEKGSE